MFRDGLPQVLTLQPFVTEQTVGIAIGTVTKHGHDGVVGTEFLRHLFRSHDVEGAAGTEVQALLVQTPVDHFDALLVRDGQRPVEIFDFVRQVVRHAPLTDALGYAAAGPLLELSSRGYIGVEDRARWIGKEAFHAAVADILEIASHARQCATCACRAGKCVDFAVGLRPDFRPGCLDMCPSVGGVVELVGPHGAVFGVFLLQSFCVSLGLPVVVFRVLPRDGGDRVDFSTEES